VISQPKYFFTCSPWKSQSLTPCLCWEEITRQEWCQSSWPSFLNVHFSLKSISINYFSGEFKYANDELYDETIALFDRFPLCALITGCKSGRFFAVHGGLSPSISKIEEIQTIERFSEPPTSGPLWYLFVFELFKWISDLLWADPVDEIPNPTRVAPQEIAVIVWVYFVFIPPRSGKKLNFWKIKKGKHLCPSAARLLITSGFCSFLNRESKTFWKTMTLFVSSEHMKLLMTVSRSTVSWPSRKSLSALPFFLLLTTVIFMKIRHRNDFWSFSPPLGSGNGHQRANISIQTI